MQELIWEIKPDIVVECGVAHGGSLVLYASILEIIGKNGKVIGVDIDIRDHNRKAIESHLLAHRIVLIQGSSTDESIVEKVKQQIKGHEKVLVTLDSNHTREHVKAELDLYSPMVTKGSYLVVFDTLIEDMPDDTYPGKPWGKGNNPKTAVFEFLKENDQFEIDYDFESKLMLTVAPSGYLKKVL